MNTNDAFNELQHNLPQIPLDAYRAHYTELTRRVNEEGSDMTLEAMHAAILVAHNTTEPKTT